MIEQLVNDAKKYVGHFMKDNDPSHDFDHVNRVYKNALMIARQESADNPLLKIDYTVLALGALFHDIADFKYERAQCLHTVAENRLKEFFKTYKHVVEETQFNEILNIVLNISFRKELEEQTKKDHSIEFQIVRDSDRLEAIGAIGIARCFGYACIKKTPFYQKDVPYISNITADEYNRQTLSSGAPSAYNHFYEKLLLLKDKMMTKTGRSLAVNRHALMVHFLQNMKTEMALE